MHPVLHPVAAFVLPAACLVLEARGSSSGGEGDNQQRGHWHGDTDVSWVGI